MADKDSEAREDTFRWLIRYVLIPLTVAAIGSWVVLEAVHMEIAGRTEPIEHSHDDLATEIFATLKAEATNVPTMPTSTPIVEPTPTPTEKPDSEEKESSDTPTPDVVEPPAPSSIVCGYVPSGWQLYIVQPGNTLFSLARETGTTIDTIRDVNCLYGQLQALQQIWLPFVPIIDKPIEEATAIVPEPILPDLINNTSDWPSMSSGCSDGCTLSVFFAVGNIGAAESGGFTTQFSVDGISIGEYRIEQILNPGELAVNQATFDIPDSCVDTSTPCQVCITVDSHNDLLEENEANNQHCELLR